MNYTLRQMLTKGSKKQLPKIEYLKGVFAENDSNAKSASIVDLMATNFTSIYSVYSYKEEMVENALCYYRRVHLKKNVHISIQKGGGPSDFVFRDFSLIFCMQA